MLKKEYPPPTHPPTPRFFIFIYIMHAISILQAITHTIIQNVVFVDWCYCHLINFAIFVIFFLKSWILKNAHCVLLAFAWWCSFKLGPNMPFSSCDCLSILFQAWLIHCWAILYQTRLIVVQCMLITRYSRRCVGVPTRLTSRACCC